MVCLSRLTVSIAIDISVNIMNKLITVPIIYSHNAHHISVYFIIFGRWTARIAWHIKARPQKQSDKKCTAHNETSSCVKQYYINI